MKNAGSGHQGTSQDILNALSETGLGPTKEELTSKDVEQAKKEITEISRRAADSARAHEEKFAKKPESSRRFFSFFCCCFSAESESTAYIELMDLHRMR